MKLAILQMSDTPQVESSAVMLRSAGYEVKACGPELRDQLKRIGCDTVVSVESAAAYGCDPLDRTIGQATLDDFRRCDLYCDIKVNNVKRVLDWDGTMRGRVAFWRVNGARPEHVIRTRNGKTEDCGDELNPGVPVITANLWYRCVKCNDRGSINTGPGDYGDEYVPCECKGRNYTFWPPYPRMADYDPSKRGRMSVPFCLCHGVGGWGFRDIVPECERMGVQVYGHQSPMGPLNHSATPQLVADGLCMVHLKGSDCPGWALYEALLGGCPVVVGRWLIARGLMYDLFADGETCLAFGVECDETGRGDPQFSQCIEDIRRSVTALKYAALNRAIGLAGRERLLELMWNEEDDGQGFKNFLQRNFG